MILNRDDFSNKHFKDKVSLLSAITPLSNTSLQKLSEIMTIAEFPKGHRLFNEGETNRDVYFILKGIARVFYLQDITEVTIQFSIEGELLLALKSYIDDENGYENIELLEPSTLFHMKFNDLQILYENDIDIANWGRKMIEKELIKTEERLMSTLFKNASQRYDELMEKYPDVLQRVKLGHIASFIGVTQVTLSRIRAHTK